MAACATAAVPRRYSGLAGGPCAAACRSHLLGGPVLVALPLLEDCGKRVGERKARSGERQGAWGGHSAGGGGAGRRGGCSPAVGSGRCTAASPRQPGRWPAGSERPAGMPGSHGAARPCWGGQSGCRGCPGGAGGLGIAGQQPGALWQPCARTRLGNRGGRHLGRRC